LQLFLAEVSAWRTQGAHVHIGSNSRASTGATHRSCVLGLPARMPASRSWVWSRGGRASPTARTAAVSRPVPRTKSPGVIPASAL